ncbi:MAG: hypothetical protein KJ043_00400 [Anaerolineae bacterium]|nr:hypothetical protein [Anaerolineae bacterium]
MMNLWTVFTTLIRQWRWIIRGIILIFVLSQLTAPRLRVMLENPPRQVITDKPKVCVHTDLVHEPPESSIQMSLQLIREMGAPTIVEFFPWAYIERTPDVYDWGQPDLILKHAENQGVKIIARMGLVPDWARPKDTTFNYIDEDGLPHFAEFVADFAERYAGQIDHIIIWNEPNLAFEWGFLPTDPKRYVDMLKLVYEPLHQANPNITVLAGALAPTLEPVGSPNGLDDLFYLQGMYEMGAKDYFDALAIHTYGFTTPPDAPPDPRQLNFRRAELLREVMVEHGDENKPVFITESGWNDNPRWTQGVRPSQRTAYTLSAFQIVENWDWAETLCLWIFRHPTPRNTHRDNFTLVTPFFQIKPIYYAIQAYARGFDTERTLWLNPPEE